jgi:PIN domain nuclease of toxin-antitoxin system
LAGKIVIDASAVLAFLNRERGGIEALQLFPEALVCAVNVAEIVQVGIRRGRNPGADLELLSVAGLSIVDVDIKIARLAGELEKTTREHDISLADRFCLALGIARNLPVLTADRVWEDLKLPLEVKRLR